ncbi:MAG: hypothetical protein RMA76_37255 [Deltaproteobacteria bacterium]
MTSSSRRTTRVPPARGMRAGATERSAPPTPGASMAARATVGSSRTPGSATQGCATAGPPTAVCAMAVRGTPATATTAAPRRATPGCRRATPAS